MRPGSSRSGTLYVVATPLGHLDDLSPRAVRTLKEVHLIACEDTRHTRKLLNHFSVKTPTTSYHEHNEESKSRELVKLLEQGKEIALVSDAGTPLLSDPGYRLVHACREKRLPVHAIPGPDAATAALSISGLPTDQFFFAGFLPRGAGAQEKRLDELSRQTATVVFYLSPHALLPTLERILRILGNRKAFLGRELTKIHETHHFGPLQEIIHRIREEGPRGEYTLIVHGSPKKKQTDLAGIDVLSYVRGLIEQRGMGKTEAIKTAAKNTGIPKSEIYKLVVDQLL